MPWRSWDGVEGSVEGRFDTQKGYCPHANPLFGTWHRPYVALFEQQLQKAAKQVASQFPASSRSKYEDAANKLRVPYWDWAKKVNSAAEAIPATMTTPNIQVTFPNGTSGQISNPLFQYTFHPRPAEINSTVSSSTQTLFLTHSADFYRAVFFQPVEMDQEAVSQKYVFSTTQ